MQTGRFIRKDDVLKLVEEYLLSREFLDAYNYVKLNSDNNHKIEFIKGMKDLFTKLCFIVSEIIEYPKLIDKTFLGQVRYLTENILGLELLRDTFSLLDIEFKRRNIKKKVLAKIELIDVDAIIYDYNELCEKLVTELGVSHFLKAKFRFELPPVEIEDDLSGETTLNLYMSKGCVLDSDLINVSLNLDVESKDRISEITYFVRLNTNDGKVLKSGKFEIENESISKLIPVQFTSKDILKEDYVYLHVEILFTHFEGLPTIASEKVINEFRSKLMILDGIDILKERVERVFRVKVAK